jgi:hypothetical protein
LNRKVEILISRGGDFVCACFFFGFGRHIEIPLSTSVAPLRQGKSKRFFRTNKSTPVLQLRRCAQPVRARKGKSL